MPLLLALHHAAPAHTSALPPRTKSTAPLNPQTLVDNGLLTPEELDSCIATHFNPIRVGFKGGPEVRAPAWPPASVVLLVQRGRSHPARVLVWVLPPLGSFLGAVLPAWPLYGGAQQLQLALLQVQARHPRHPLKVWVEDCLNLGVSPKRLLDLVKAKVGRHPRQLQRLMSAPWQPRSRYADSPPLHGSWCRQRERR